MIETWLRTNTRAVIAGLLWPGILLLLGLFLAMGGGGLFPNGWVRGVGVVIGVLSAIALAAVSVASFQPRLAYKPGWLLFYFQPQDVIQVPIDVVEGFLLGRSPTGLPGKRNANNETITLVVRLAERASEWERIEIDRTLGTWCGHYVTIRGTWCEPLGVDLVNRLNARLHEVKHAESGRVVKQVPT